MENYITEAFQKLRLLNEDDFDLTADRDRIDDLQSFVADDVEGIPEEPVIDVTAESEEELADNYVGKVIIECECCHSRLYKDEEEVIIDEESGMANKDEVCPVCGNALGYAVIGKIEPFTDDISTFDDDEEEDEEDEIELENDPADEEPIESLRQRFKNRRAIFEAKDVEEEDDVEPPADDVKIGKKKECKDCDEECNEGLEDYSHEELQVEDDVDLETPGENPVIDDPGVGLKEDVSLEEKTKFKGGANFFQKIKDVLASTKTIFKLSKKAVQDGEYSDADVILKELGKASKEVTAMLKADIPLTNEKFQKAYKEMVCFTAMMILYIFHNGDVEGLPDPDDILDAYTMRVEGDTVYDDFGAYNEDIKIAAAGLGFSKKIFNIEESLQEGVENLSLDTDDTHVEVNSDEEGTHVDVSPKSADEFGDDLDFGGDEFGGEGEEIVPLSDEEQGEILDNTDEEEPIDDLGLEDELGGEEEFGDEELPAEEEPEEEEEEELPAESLRSPKKTPIKEEVEDEDDIDIDEFDECAFNDVCESYLRKVYENVNTFKTVAVKDTGDKIVVEGIIRFKNKKAMKSTFVFTEAKEMKSGKVVLEGYNKTFSSKAKSFKIKGSLTKNHYVTESLAYNYTVRSLNESKQIERTKVAGRVKVRK